ATIENGWHVYSQFIEEGGPQPTSFSFAPSSQYSLVGKVTESPKAISAFDPNFKMDVAWHENAVSFKQKIKLKEPKVTVKGTLEFMVCDDVRCLPPAQEEFAIHVDASKTFPSAVAASSNNTTSAAASEQTTTESSEE